MDFLAEGHIYAGRRDTVNMAFGQTTEERRGREHDLAQLRAEIARLEDRLAEQARQEAESDGAGSCNSAGKSPN